MRARRRASRPTSRSSMPAWPNSSPACSVSLTTGLDIRTIFATLPSCSSRQLFFSLFLSFLSCAVSQRQDLREQRAQRSRDHCRSLPPNLERLLRLARLARAVAPQFGRVPSQRKPHNTHTHNTARTRRFLLVAMFFFLTIAVSLATSKATRRRPPSVSCTLPRSWWNISSPRANSRYRSHPHARSLFVVPTHRAAHSIGV